MGTRVRLVRAFFATFTTTLLVGLVFVLGYALGSHSGASAAEQSSLIGRLKDVQQLLSNEFLGDMPSDSTQVYAAIRGLVQSYNDPYTVFVEPVSRTIERDELRGHFGGIGAGLSRNERNELFLTPVRDRPAARAGVLDGDVLLAVDGTPVTAEMTVDQIVVLVRGEVGTAVVLRLRRAAVDQPFDVTVVRERIETPSVDWRVLDAGAHIGYVHIALFGERTSGELQIGLNELAGQGVNEIVLDLRGNGGGYLDAAVDTSSHFLAQGVVLRELKRGGDEKLYPVKQMTGPGQQWVIAVLVDGGTASASEIVAGALRDNQRARLIGEKTFGKGSVQRVHELGDGSSLHVTVARWLTPDRHQIDKAGLQPDVAVTFSEDDRKAGRDPQMARAVELLKGE